MTTMRTVPLGGFAADELKLIRRSVTVSVPEARRR
jgi:hypothetical protein